MKGMCVCAWCRIDFGTFVASDLNNEQVMVNRNPQGGRKVVGVCLRSEGWRAYLQVSYALDFDVCAHGEFFDGDACPALDRLAINFELFILAWKIDFMDESYAADHG